MYEFSSCLTENTLYLHYKDQMINALSGDSYCSFCESFQTHEHTLEEVLLMT
jgi:hypothetical protein